MAGAGSSGPAWIDTPGTCHDRGCGFTIAEGHSESHHWLSIAPKSFGAGRRQFDPANSADLKYLAWMQQRTSALAN
jgi:hypothetical protein